MKSYGNLSTSQGGNEMKTRCKISMTHCRCVGCRILASLGFHTHMTIKEKGGIMLKLD